ncbi:MAG: response regulator [Candidatus Magnetobacterium sp. LHC-1]|uniref:Response regulator n=1 Tax=Candidatus Magnetobacterium casense TaxID=1455061 RepID=A0ABS6RYZ7_9BACT|nr:response regulator [Candidatus Magnetobacterium casensis]MBF0608957.1 response regulator [Nitrospirota bacterium]MBV6341259.1 response regulator [Candidatus Magnetobacterium casensis]
MTNESILKTLTVLYVEDDEFIRKMLGRFLRRRVAVVYDAGNGKEGLNAYIEHQDKIDIVITDIEMPVMNGIEMIERIFAINNSQPIIITTAYKDEEHMSEKVCLNVIKPIDEEMLLKCIIHCVETKSQQKDGAS